MATDSNVKMIPIETRMGTFNVWTKRVGDNPKIKLLLLHGGPGATCELLENFENFLGKDIEFYFYNQLGSYLSDQPDATCLWTVERFVDEVEQVRKALGLNKDNFYLFGHSWGGILALEYALAYQDNLKGLIISNMMSSCPDYGKYADNVLAKQMDREVLEAIKELEAHDDYQNPKYMELLMPNFYVKHVCRLQPWPEALNRGMSHINNEIYILMQGPSEFGLSGLLKNWDRKNDLSKISVPTLTIGATYDTMDPEHMKWMASQVQNGSSLICPNGSNCAMWDDAEYYFSGLIDFIKKVDNGEEINVRN
jgi:proline iminopeptidase